MSGDRSLPCLVSLLVLSAAVMLKQFVTPGYYSVIDNDTITYTRWAHQFTAAFKEGIFYPRWMPEECGGYGSATFILYSPLPFYLTAFLESFTGSITQAMNVAKALSLFVTGTGLYYLLKEIYSGKTALLVSVLYVCYPFNILLLYAFGSFAALISSGWFAPILLCGYRYCRDGGSRNLLHGGLCYGGLILTHLVSAYMFGFVLAGFILLMAASTRRWRSLYALPGMVATALLVSSAYLLPLVLENRYLNLQAFVARETGHDYARFFVLPDLSSEFPAHFYWGRYHDLFAMHLYLMIAVLILVAVAEAKATEAPSGASCRSSRIFLWLAGLSVFLQFGVSRFLWELVPLFKFIQYPIRWLAISVFLVCLAFGMMIHRAVNGTVSNRRRSTVYVCLTLLLGLLLVVDAEYIQGISGYTDLELRHAQGDEWSLEHIPAGVRPAEVRRFDFAEKAALREGEGETRVVDWASAQRVVDIFARTDATVRIRTFNFPGWSAYVDEVKTRADAEPGSHAILVRVPAGRHRLELRFEDTPARVAGKTITLLSLLLLVVTLIADAGGKGRAEAV